MSSFSDYATASDARDALWSGTQLGTAASKYDYWSPASIQAILKGYTVSPQALVTSNIQESAKNYTEYKTRQNLLLLCQV